MNVLFVTHDSLLSPILHRQGLPHIRELVKKGVTFTILSFEKRRWNEEEIESITKLGAMLKDQGIDWHMLRYTKFPFLPTGALDILWGLIYSSLLVLTKRIRIVHARSYVPAAIGLVLKRFLKVKFIFDLRGLFADEYITVGNWTTKNIFYRLTKKLEKWCILGADINVVTSEPFKDYLKGLPYVKEAGRDLAIETIPNCVDTDRFTLDLLQRDRKRKELGMSDKLILVYTGALLKWHSFQEMVDFFFHLKVRCEKAYFWIITYDDSTVVGDYLKGKGLKEIDFSLFSAAPDEVAPYLMMADVGISFIQPTFTQRIATPIKFAEYLASGLPVVINSGIGGTDSIVRDDNLGVVIDRFDSASYTDAVEELLSLLAEGEPLKRRCRQAAKGSLSLASAVDKYYTVYQKLCSQVGDDRSDPHE